MCKSKIPVILLFILILPVANICFAGVDIGLSLDRDGLKSFHLAVGEHYQVPEKELVVVREAKVSDEELPVVFYLAGRAGVSTQAIIKLRLDGKSWMDISAHCGLGPEIYYVSLKTDPGPPYGNAYGHFKNRNRNEWRNIKLTDDDIVNFVNLKFLSEHYGYSPDEIVKMRAKGQDFISVNTEIKKNKGQSKKDYTSNSKSQGKGKGKGKGKK